MEIYNLNEKDAENLRKRKDFLRKSYHNNHCKGKWGDSRNYHLSINSSILGLDKTIDFLEGYIKERMELN